MEHDGLSEGGLDLRGPTPGPARARLALVWLAAAVVCGCGDPDPKPMPPEPDAITDGGLDVGDGCGEGFAPSGDGCRDVDECAAGTHGCDPRTECINLTGGFNCGSCPAPYEGTGVEPCALPCPPGQHDGGDGVCLPEGQCTPGYEEVDGACVGPLCRPGQHFDGVDGCLPLGRCAPGFQVADDGRCVPCPEGQHDDGTGSCVPRGTCARDFEVDADGDCVPCAEGQHDDGTGRCAPEGVCAPGFQLDPEGICAGLACPDDDAGEDDDSPGQARPLAGRVEGIACAGDPDVFALEPGGACRAIVRMEVLEGAPQLSLIDADGRMLSGGMADGEAVEARLDLQGPAFAMVDGEGVYRIEAAYEGHDGGDGACVDVGACSTGWALDDDGACSACADGFWDDGFGGCLAGGPPAGRCEAGSAIDRLDRCQPLQVCPEGERDARGGYPCQRLGCAPGYHLGGGEPGICLPEGDCEPGFVDRGDGDCSETCLGAFVRAGRVCVRDFECPADDDIELEEVSEPAELVAGQSRYGVVCPDDSDTFEVDLPTGCGARVLLRFDPAEGALALEVGELRGVDTPEGQRLVLEGFGGETDIRVVGLGEASVRYAVRVDVDGHDGGDGACQRLGECSPGYAVDGDLACTLCAEDFVREVEGGPCVFDLRCDPGQHDGGDGLCVPDDRCSAGFHDGNGVAPGVPCVEVGRCVEGLHDGGDGTCVPEGACSAGHHDGDGPDGPADDCVEEGACSVGFADGGDGVCRPVGACSPGFHDGNGVADRSHLCLPLGVCARGLHDGGDGDCVPLGGCSADYIDRGDGGCTLDDALNTACADGYRFTFADGCACEPGTQAGGDGGCAPEGECSPGFHPAAPGAGCVPIGVCAPGHHSTPWGACRPTADCPEGTRDDGIGRCVTVAAGCAAGFGDRGGLLCATPPGCADGFHDGGDGRCVPLDGCADGFRPSINGCVPDAGCSRPTDFDDAHLLTTRRPAGGVLCGDDTWRLELPEGCGVELRLVADEAAGMLDLELYDAARTLVARAEALDGRARLWVGSPARTAFARVAAYPPGVVDPVPYRLELVVDPARCRAECDPDTRPDGAGRCVPLDAPCAPGWHEGGGADCVPLDRCAAGFRDGGDGVCLPFDECAPGFSLTQGFDCRRTADCPEGLFDDGGGECAAICDEIAGYRDGRDPGAAAPLCTPAGYCAPGYADRGDGLCILRQPGASCVMGAEPPFDADPSGLCLQARCPDGNDRDSLFDPEILDVLDGDTRRDRTVCAGDPGDWYAVSANGSVLRVRLRFHHGTSDLGLFIRAEDGTLLAVADSRDDDEVTALVVDRDVVIIEVAGDGRAAGYRLDVAVQEAD